MSISRITDLPARSTLDGNELLEISQLSPSVRIAAATISAAASDNSFNDSASGFVAAGFVVGDRVNVIGFTTSGNNLLVGTITAVTTAKMTIGGTDGDSIADEVAGDSVVIAKWTSRRATAQDIADLASVSATLPEVATVSGTTADLLDSDVNKYLRFTNASAKSLTVRPNSTHALPADGEWHIRNVGAADLTIVEGSGVTVNPPADGSLVIPQGGTATLKRVATDEFDLLGYTSAP